MLHEFVRSSARTDRRTRRDTEREAAHASRVTYAGTPGALRPRMGASRRGPRRGLAVCRARHSSAPTSSGPVALSSTEGPDTPPSSAAEVQRSAAAALRQGRRTHPLVCLCPGGRRVGVREAGPVAVFVLAFRVRAPPKQHLDHPCLTRNSFKFLSAHAQLAGMAPQ
jgi:hypothetical protein